MRVISAYRLLTSASPVKFPPIRVPVKYASDRRFFCTKKDTCEDTKLPPAFSVQSHSNSADLDAEIYDVPFDIQWEEDPEFDYIQPKQKTRFYDFITDSENFELKELCALLRAENVRDLIFLKLPADAICGHMVIGTCSSKPHLRSTASLIYKILKFKRNSNSRKLPKLDGLDGSCEWITIDLGCQVMLHLFQPSVRSRYDLESLWAAGPEWDERSRLRHKLPVDHAFPSTHHKYDWDKILEKIKKIRPTDKFGSAS